MLMKNKDNIFQIYLYYNGDDNERMRQEARSSPQVLKENPLRNLQHNNSSKMGSLERERPLSFKDVQTVEIKIKK